MSTVMTSLIVCNSSEETEKFGALLGRRLKGSEVIELVSDLGGGKTTLTRGIARGAGSSDVVGSPTFMLNKIYKAGKCEIHHFDFYRLADAGILEHELQSVLEDPSAAIVVEWGEMVQHVLPEKRLVIRINKTSDDGRELEFTYPKELEYLVEQK